MVRNGDPAALERLTPWPGRTGPSRPALHLRERANRTLQTTALGNEADRVRRCHARLWRGRPASTFAARLEGHPALFRPGPGVLRWQARHGLTDPRHLVIGGAPVIVGGRRPRCRIRSRRGIRLRAVVVQRIRRIGRPFNAGYCTQILVDCPYILIAQVLKIGPWHHLE